MTTRCKWTAEELDTLGERIKQWSERVEWLNRQVEKNDVYHYKWPSQDLWQLGERVMQWAERVQYLNTLSSKGVCERPTPDAGDWNSDTEENAMDDFELHVHSILLFGDGGCSAFEVRDGVIYATAPANVKVPDRIKYGGFDMPVVVRRREGKIIPL